MNTSVCRFSRAVREGLLTDYKVLVLCVDEDYVKDIMGEQLKQDETGAIELDDAVRLVGCYNGLRKKSCCPPMLLQVMLIPTTHLSPNYFLTMRTSLPLTRGR